MPAVTANPDGSYVFPEIPLAYAGKSMRVYDPATTRQGWFTAARAERASEPCWPSSSVSWSVPWRR